MRLTLVPSYGRDYKSAKAVKIDWEADKDFTIADVFHPDNGRQINRLQASKGDVFNIRYKELREICQIKH